VEADAGHDRKGNVVRHLPGRPSLDHYRGEARTLLRAHLVGDLTARDRAHRVIRNRGRFVLADAQYVIAREHGFRSWSEFRRAIEAPREEPRLAAVRAQLDRARAAWGETAEAVLDPGLTFGDGEALHVAVRKRLHRYDISDDGLAVEKAGRPAGWLEIAREVVQPMNVNRNGNVFVQAVEGRDLAPLVVALADAAMAVHEALLDLS
jgi:hypothetical protein